MATILEYLNDASSPISYLDNATKVNANDLFIVEDLALKQRTVPILIEQKLSAIMLELGLDINIIPLITEIESELTAKELPVLLEEKLSAVFLELGIDISEEDVVLSPLITEFKSEVLDFAHEPYKISYDLLSTALLEDIKVAMGFGTMAHRESYQHSRLGHEHDYANVECFTNYQLSDVTSETDVELSTLTSWLGSLNIWKRKTISSDYLPVKYDIFMPKIEFDKYETPQVGEMRLAIQSNEFTKVRTSSKPPEKYDYINPIKDHALSRSLSADYYWAYCNGQTISCGENEFQDACKVFAKNPKATQFTIPRCNNFMRLNPRKKYENALEKIDYENALSSHSHAIIEIDKTKEFLADATITIPTIRNGMSDSSSGNAIHSGSGTPNYETSLNKLTCTINIEGSSVSSSAIGSTSNVGIDKETYPIHEQVPMIVFLGAK